MFHTVPSGAGARLGFWLSPHALGGTVLTLKTGAKSVLSHSVAFFLQKRYFGVAQPTVVEVNPT